MKRMTTAQPRRSGSSRRALAMWFGIAASIVVGACSPTAPAPSPSPTSIASAEPSPATTNALSPEPEVGQTDTDWGRIWDAVPADFPVYPGATPAEEAASGPVSATFVLDDGDTRAIATWMQNELERAGYKTDALNGPLEDGSFVLEMARAQDCQVEVAVAPLGGLVTINVRYSATCQGP